MGLLRLSSLLVDGVVEHHSARIHVLLFLSDLIGFPHIHILEETLTSIQIGQFCIYGIVAATHTYMSIQNFAWSIITTYSHDDPSQEIGSKNSFAFSYNQGCKGSLWLLAFGIVVNISILALFLNFFKKTYVKKFISNTFDNPPTCKDKIE